MDFVLQPLHRMALAHLINRLLFGINHIIFVFPSETWNVTVLPAIAFLKSIRFNDPLVGVCYSREFLYRRSNSSKSFIDNTMLCRIPSLYLPFPKLANQKYFLLLFKKQSSASKVTSWNSVYTKTLETINWLYWIKPVFYCKCPCFYYLIYPQEYGERKQGKRNWGKKRICRWGNSSFRWLPSHHNGS